MKPIGEIVRDKLQIDTRCRLCGTHRDLHRHHIVPRSRKLCHEPDNIVVVCHACHRDIHAKRVDLAPALTSTEQAKAVELTGSIESARMLLMPLAYRKVTHEPI